LRGFASPARDALARLNGEIPLPEDAGEAAVVEQALDNEVLARLSDLQGAAANPEDRLFRKQVIAAIIALPPDERKAVVLCHYYGFKEESEDPTEQTAATLCGVTGRTIRNRLTRALVKLSKLKEDA
jgi:DNA-directed RNA polymerase specialized sigma24 family protein